MTDPLQNPTLTPAQIEMLNFANVEQLHRGDAARPATPATPAMPAMPPNPPVPPRPSPRMPGYEAQPVTGPARLEHVNPALLQMAQAISRIVATRILLLIGVLTSSVVWGVVVAEPTQLGIIAAGVYSVVGVWPLVVLYAKTG
jgi:hypothetical protein